MSTMDSGDTVPTVVSQRTALVVDVGGGCVVWGQEVYGKSLYLPFNFAVNPKLF